MILINSVLILKPLCYLSVYPLPDTTLDSVSKFTRKFLWAKYGNYNGVHLMGWHTIVLEKIWRGFWHQRFENNQNGSYVQTCFSLIWMIKIPFGSITLMLNIAITNLGIAIFLSNAPFSLGLYVEPLTWLSLILGLKISTLMTFLF